MLPKMIVGCWTWVDCYADAGSVDRIVMIAMGATWHDQAAAMHAPCLASQDEPMGEARPHTNRRDTI
jgi:hypothetical protein